MNIGVGVFIQYTFGSSIRSKTKIGKGSWGTVTPFFFVFMVHFIPAGGRLNAEEVCSKSLLSLLFYV